MKQLAVMVVTPDPGLDQYLASRLPPDRFEVTEVRPGAPLVDAVDRTPPDIVVLDRIEERGDAVQVEIALLKRRRPEVRVIAVSEHSSAKDATVVEQGVFFYLAGHSRTEECVRLVDLITAAAESIHGSTRADQRQIGSR